MLLPQIPQDIFNICINYLYDDFNRDRDKILKIAFENKWKDLFKWIISCKIKIDNDNYLHYRATNYGDLESLKFLCACGYKLDSWILSNAAAYGHIEIFKWAASNNCPCSERTHINANSSSNKEIKKWLENNECSCKIKSIIKK